MGNKALKIFYAAVMGLMLVALVIFMIMHISEGLGGTYSKLMLAFYVLLIVWAALRVYTLVKEVIRK